jgi:hypothetical protein
MLCEVCSKKRLFDQRARVKRSNRRRLVDPVTLLGKLFIAEGSCFCVVQYRRNLQV